MIAIIIVVALVVAATTLVVAFARGGHGQDAMESKNILDFPELAAYPAVRNVYVNSAWMFVSDIRAMLQLDVAPALGSGCNFSATLMLCNVLIGVAEQVLARDDPEQNCRTCTSRLMQWGTGKRIRTFLMNWFPWPPGTSRKTKDSCTNALYDFVRNPLTHRLGILRTGERPVGLLKRPLTLAEIEELERSMDQPEPPPIRPVDDAYEVCVPSLYWAVLQTLRSFAKDETEMRKAQERLAATAPSPAETKS